MARGVAVVARCVVQLEAELEAEPRRGLSAGAADSRGGSGRDSSSCAGRRAQAGVLRGACAAAGGACMRSKSLSSIAGSARDGSMPESAPSFESIFCIRCFTDGSCIITFICCITIGFCSIFSACCTTAGSARKHAQLSVVQACGAE